MTHKNVFLPRTTQTSTVYNLLVVVYF